MNQLLTRLVNDKKLTKGVVATSIVLSVVSHIAIFTGVYFLGIGKGFEIGEMEETNNEQNS